MIVASGELPNTKQYIEEELFAAERQSVTDGHEICALRLSQNMVDMPRSRKREKTSVCLPDCSVAEKNPMPNSRRDEDACTREPDEVFSQPKRRKRRRETIALRLQRRAARKKKETFSGLNAGPFARSLNP